VNQPLSRPANSVDSFERFNRAQDADSLRSPDPLSAELRVQGAIAKLDPAAMIGADNSELVSALPIRFD
jgi:hypothetical protein